MADPKVISWYLVGKKDAEVGNPYRPPEHYSSRNQYRLGYESVRSIMDNGGVEYE